MRFRPAMDATTGELYLPVEERGRQLLEEPLLNKGTAFTPEEREALGLRGLLPAHTSTMDEQLARVRTQWDAKPNALEKHIYLAGLHDRNETLFHRFILENLQETVPVVYTPTVAEACRHWSRIHRHARGIYVTPGRPRADRPAAALPGHPGRGGGGGDRQRAHPGHRRPGLRGHGHPHRQAGPLQRGRRHPSLAVRARLPRRGHQQRGPAQGPALPGLAGAPAARRPLLVAGGRVRHGGQGGLPPGPAAVGGLRQRHLLPPRGHLPRRHPSFNDDIEGTAAMVVGGLLAAMRRIGRRLGDQVYAIYGGGSAGTGIYRQLVTEMESGGPLRRRGGGPHLRHRPAGPARGGRQEPRPSACATLATKREVVKAWHVPGDRITLEQVVEHAQPTVLIGVCARPGQFTEPLIRAMA